MKQNFALTVLTLLLSTSSLFAAHSDYVLLERSTKGLPKTAPFDSSVIWVYASGKVYGQSCQTVAQQTFPVTYGKVCKAGSFFKSLKADEVSKIQILIEETKLGKIKGPVPGLMTCAAVPVESITYWVTYVGATSQCSRFIYTGTQPCGSIYKNDSAATDDLRQLMDELRNEFSKA